MNIKYNPKPLKTGFILGTLFLLIGILSIIFAQKTSLFFLGSGFAYIIIGVYRLKNDYVTVQDGYIKKDFGAKMFLKDITQIKYFAGDYIIKSKEVQITIDINAVDKKSLKDLEEFINPSL